MNVNIKEKFVNVGNRLRILFNKPYFRMFVDEKGIPINDYGYLNGIFVGKQRSIIAIAEKGLDYWNKYHLGDTKDKVLLSYNWDKFPENKKKLSSTMALRMLLNCADWLLENAMEYNKYMIWEYKYPSFYNTKPPWRSSQAQAVGMQLLIRGYELTGNREYLSCAERSIQSFHIPTEDGGITDKISSDEWWYEKFADAKCERPKVLNGMMFALIGLWDFYDRRNNNNAKFLFNKGVFALKKILPKYDAGNWSYYDLLGKLASEKYHKIHIYQLDMLYKITKEPVFREYYRRFKKHILQ